MNKYVFPIKQADAQKTWYVGEATRTVSSQVLHSSLRTQVVSYTRNQLAYKNREDNFNITELFLVYEITFYTNGSYLVYAIVHSDDLMPLHSNPSFK